MNNLELRESKEMNVMNFFNKSELESQKKILDYLIETRKYKKIADNIFLGDLEK